MKIDNEKIISIEEISGKFAVHRNGVFEECDGYAVTTESHTYSIIIENGQNCCENWGYFSAGGEFSDFIGKKLVKLRIQSTESAESFRELDRMEIESSSAEFVDFIVDDGMVLQFTVYNEHNGYYGHDIYVLKDNEVLFAGAL